MKKYNSRYIASLIVLISLWTICYGQYEFSPKSSDYASLSLESYILKNISEQLTLPITFQAIETPSPSFEAKKEPIIELSPIPLNSNILTKDNIQTNKTTKENRSIDIRARLAAFLPTECLLKNIYGKALPCFELEISSLLKPHLSAWGNFSYSSKKGKSWGLCYPTCMRSINISAGLALPWCINKQSDLYIGLGANLINLRLKNTSICTYEEISKCSGGLILKTGIIWHHRTNLQLNLFADYLYQPITFQKKINVGGFKIGAGIGFSF